MIHEDDEIEPEPLNFSWIYYISRAKLKLTDKESGRLTLKQFRNLYQAYKDTFDVELVLTLSRKTYASLKKQQEEADEWI